MRTRNSVFIAAATVLAASCAKPSPDTAGDVAQLRSRIMREWPAAAMAGDVDAYLSFLTEDMVYMPPDAPAMTSKAEVAEFLRGAFASATFDITIDEPDEIVVAGPWAFARYHVSLVAHPMDGSADVAMDRKCLDIWRRQPDGTWKAHRHMWNDNPAPAAVGTEAR